MSSVLPTVSSVSKNSVICVTNCVTNLILLTQVDDVPELLQEFSLSVQCPVVVVGGVTELTVSSQQCMEDSEGHQAVRLAVQLRTEARNVISNTVEPQFKVISLVRSPLQYGHPCSVLNYLPQYN